MTSTDLENDQKELCAITVMRMMLEDYSIKKGILFEEALCQFAASPTYMMLFDFSTGLWREGPDYLCDTFVQDMKKETEQAV